MIFQPGDKVNVQEHLKEEWQSLCHNGPRPEAFKVAVVSRNRLICCAGHLQHLIMTDSTQASGMWFDPDLVGKKRKMCGGTGPLHLYDSGHPR